jgi:hypothetical protein
MNRKYLIMCYKKYENIINQKLKYGRGYYLRFEVPTTWQILEDNDMEIDSTCGYADREGFRCGTGDEFSVFNILSRKKLNLKERPLVFMDDNHYSYNKNITGDNSLNILKNIINQAERYNTHLTFLFHNSIFTQDKNIDFKKLYEKTVNFK